MIFGDRHSFAFELRPLDGAPEESDPSASATWAALRIWVEGRNLAEHTHVRAERYHDALHWPAVYLARWLVHAWPAFFETQRWPIPGAWRNARRICAALDRRVLDEDEKNADGLDDLLDLRDDFVRTHSLRAAAAGGLVPDLYFGRDGARVSVAWSDPEDDADAVFQRRRSEADIPVATFVDAARGLVAWCADRLESNPKCSSDVGELRAWLAHVGDAQASAEASLAGYLGTTPDELATAVGGRPLETILELPADWKNHGATFDPSSSGAAIVFRALRPSLSIEEVVGILDRLQAFPSAPAAAEQIDTLRRTAPATGALRLDYLIGTRLARHVRGTLNNPDRQLDIEGVLKTWGVPVEEFPIKDQSTDGGCVWDAGHGPVILLNPRSKRTASKWGRRMVLAHELCHLLFDRKSAARLKVMSGPWAPPTLEQRADAFAAELLLPKAGIVREIGIPESMPVDEDLDHLMHTFGVGFTTCINRLHDLFGVEMP